ncbi:unnamed protein product [Allacma fusca]|uniref:Uncharacterized protein n=1 Tax=Allacma fusca TaxID=39272 RepID=A0A8J2LC67_9HEXA|nr:unnamed protein product [Allacma fusca]
MTLLKKTVHGPEVENLDSVSNTYSLAEDFDDNNDSVDILTTNSENLLDEVSFRHQEQKDIEHSCYSEKRKERKKGSSEILTSDESLQKLKEKSKKKNSDPTYNPVETRRKSESSKRQLRSSSDSSKHQSSA